MSAPLVVNTRDGVCWTRRAVTSGGIALYAPESVKSCPEFAMATIDELAEQGIVGSAFALPMPEASNGEQPVMRARGRVEALVSGEVSEELEVRLDDLLAVACEPLRARVAELEAQRDALAARLKRGQEWQPGRTPALVSQDYLSQDELRSIFGIPLVAPWDDTEDPCHPCGCPTRFDRHAWGCPTLPAEDDVTGFFQPGHAYTHRPGADTIGGPRLRFYCETVTTDRTTGQPVARGWGGRRYGDRWTSVQRARGLEDWRSGQWVDTTDGEREPAAPLTVFRASHDSIVMGLYTTAAEARKHCEAEERRAWAKHHELNFDWIVDEEDGVAEMTAFVGGEECTTGYVVTALEVAAAYDEEADQ